MKLGIDIFCTSQASTAIRLTTMDVQEASSSLSSSSITQLGGTRAIDRHNPIIRDARRSSIPLPLPCTSQPPPVAPIPYKQLHHKFCRKNSSKSKPNDQNNNSSKKSRAGATVQKKKSKIDIDGGEIVRKSFAKRGDLMINGPDSSRYLLGETVLYLGSDFEPGLELVPVNANNKTKAGPAVKTEETSDSNSNPPPPSSSPSPDQVVVLRVSLHCKGCEGKVRKHISRMQGVTYFNIDFAAKKVTVVGDVTPLGVLSSISKVKTAQLWTPPMPMPMPMPYPLPAAANSSFSEIKKSKAVAVGI